MTFEHETYSIQSTEEFNRKIIEAYLLNIWQSRSFLYAENFEPKKTQDLQYQPFFRFDGNQAKARNFVGFFQIGTQLVEIYPKVFSSLPEPEKSKSLMLEHLFYWFSYCRKIKFPYTTTQLDTTHAHSIPELLVYLFTKHCRDTVNIQPYSRYEEVAETLAYPKGRIDFRAYINHGLSKGNFQYIDCIQEPFIYNNRLNQVIKYVARLLLPITKLSETQNLLQQIIFTLDEVEDKPCTSQDLDQIFLNPLFSDYEIIVEWCKRFLDMQLYSHIPYDMNQWSLLLPMEYVFEDFIAGFLEQHFSSDFKVHYQKSELYLSKAPKAFNMQHDIFLTHRETGQKIIIDTKYKVRRNKDPLDKKKGVSQMDMYQVLSYAYRRGCDKVLLVYPNANEVCEEPFFFKIYSGFNDQETILIYGLEIPFWNSSGISSIDESLKEKFKEIFNNINHE